MKLVFNELNTPSGVIEVSFDGGSTWISYGVDELRKNNNEIHFNEEQCPDLTQIKIKGRFKTYSDIDALYNPNTIVSVAKPEGGDAFTSDAIVNYVGDQIGNLNQDKIGSVGSYIDSIKEDKGIITATNHRFDTIISKDSTNNNVPSSKAVYDALQSLGNLYTIKDSVSTFSDLPTTGNKLGDVRNCKDTGTNYVWIEDKWTNLGGTDVMSALDYAGATTEGTGTEFITQVTQDDGLVHATKAALPKATEATPGITRLNDSITSSSTESAATANAVRRVNESIINEISDRKNSEAVIKVDIRNEVSDREKAIKGISATNDTAIKQALAKLIGYTNNTRPDVYKTVSAFAQEDGKVTLIFKDIEIEQSQVKGLTDALDQEVYDRDIAIRSEIDKLDCAKIGKSGSYIKYIKETNGIIQPEIQAFDSTLNATSDTTNAPNSKVVYDAIMAEANTRDEADKAEVTARNTAITNAINALDAQLVGSDGNYIKTIKETNGKISAVKNAFDTTISSSSTDANAPTSKAVYDAIQALGSVYNLKSPVAKESDLPTIGNTVGDVRDVQATGDNYVWTGTTWDRLGGASLINTLDYKGATSDGSVSTSFITQVTQNNGKITATKMDLPTASTATAGIVKLNDTSSSDSTLEAATAHALKVVKTALDTEITNRTNAINALDGTITGTAAVANTLTALSEKDGKVSATFGAIQIAQSQVTGLTTALSGKQASGSYKTTQAAVSTPDASGNTASFIDTISQDTNGKITVTKKDVTTASTTTAGIVKLNDTSSSDSTTEAATAHALKVVKAALDTEITNRTNAINALDVSIVGEDGNYIKTIKETNGKISAVKNAFDTTISSSSTNDNAPTSKAVYDAIQALGNVYNIKSPVAKESDLPTTDNTIGDVRDVQATGDNYVWTGTTWDKLGGTSLINALDYNGATSTGSASTSFITQVTQTNGKISATKMDLPTASTTTAGIAKLNDTSSSDSTTEAATAHALKVVKTALDTEITNRTNAIAALDGTITGTAGVANTLTALSEKDGKVSATFGAIQIEQSQVTGLVDAISNLSKLIEELQSKVSTLEAGTTVIPVDPSTEPTESGSIWVTTK